MVEVTREDYATAKAANLVWASAIGGPSVSVIAAAIARIAALEEAAKVADEYVAFHDKHDDGLSGFTHMALGAREVAEEIRALKGPSNA